MSGNKGFIKRYFEFPLIYKIMIGFFAGIILGMMIGESADAIHIFGDIFIRLLKMIVMPIIFTTIVVGAASISPKSLGRIGGKILIYYIFTTVIAILIGLAAGNIFNLGSGIPLPPPEDFTPGATPPGITHILIGVIPENPFASLAKGDPLPIIFFTLIFGLGLAYLRHSKKEKIARAAEELFDISMVLAEVIFKITHGILEYAPFGVFAIMAGVIGAHGMDVIGPFVKLIVIAYAAMLFHILVTYCGLLSLFGINPIRFFKATKEALVTAYVSRTSSGTLPVSLACAEEKLGVSNRISSFTLPLGATINMDGTAIYLVLEVMFASQIFGVELTISQQAAILVTVLLASIGTAGIPSASIILLGGVLKVANLPLSVIPMFAGFDPICDMMRTFTNVAGDLVGTTIVAKTEGEMDEKE